MGGKGSEGLGWGAALYSITGSFLLPACLAASQVTS